MATWIVGDIHGCADELAELVATLALGASDRLFSCGDLFHRGPDPAGVVDVLERCAAGFVLGNHERVVLRRFALAPRRADGADRPPERSEFPPLDSSDLVGDGGSRCDVAPPDRVRILRFLQRHSGYFLSSEQLAGAGPTPDGRRWRLVHAGVLPGVAVAENPVDVLTSIRRLSGRGAPWWYEAWRGPELVLFGHTPSPFPRAQRHAGRLVALGLDTGCVYGGRLTAYSPELDEVASVAARRVWAAA